MKKITSLFFCLLSLFFIVRAEAQDFPERPVPPKLVNDLIGILSQEEQVSLEQKLVRFNDSTTTQIAIVIVPALNGYDKADYAIQLGEKWGVGRKGKDNGILVLIKPKIGQEKGEVFISVGYGLEGVIPDAITKRIVENEMIPEFKQNNYYAGIDRGTNVLMSLATKEFTAGEYQKRTEQKPYALAIPIIIIIAVMFLIRTSRARSYSIGKGIPFWAAFWLLSSMANRGSGSHWGNFSSGSGGFGGFGGGGGFGGFGGGSFGGGGAGGSW